jgi:hypothetical protein
MALSDWWDWRKAARKVATRSGPKSDALLGWAVILFVLLVLVLLSFLVHF